MDRRLAVMEATMHLIAQKGIHNTPMSSIYKRANVAAGTIYHHFNSKDELLGATYIWIMQRLGEELHSTKGGEYSYQERFTEYWQKMFNFFVQHRNEYRYIEYCAKGPLLSIDIKQTGNDQLQELVEFLQAGMFQQTLSPMPIQLMLALVQHSVMTAIYYIDQHERADIEQTTTIALTACWKSIKS